MDQLQFGPAQSNNTKLIVMVATVAILMILLQHPSSQCIANTASSAKAMLAQFGPSTDLANHFYKEAAPLPIIRHNSNNVSETAKKKCAERLLEHIHKNPNCTAMMFANWCVHCKNQMETFGKLAGSNGVYVEAEHIDMDFLKENSVYISLSYFPTYLRFSPTIDKGVHVEEVTLENINSTQNEVASAKFAPIMEYFDPETTDEGGVSFE